MRTQGEILLASASPRRRAFLEGAGVPLRVAPVDLDETPRRGEPAADFAIRMAAEKADAAADAEGPGARWTIASDTVVVLDEQVLGKPTDPADARRMLTSLAGRTHTVLTAWAVTGPGGRLSGLGKTQVGFRPLEAAEIEAYLASGEPFDKAGAYGIQGAAGDFVDTVEGDYDTVVGLPLADVVAALRAAGALSFDSEIEARGAVVRGRIAAAAQGADRAADAVTLVAVCKMHPVAAAQAAVAAGLLDLGENYAQPLRDKATALGPPARWHFIGRLQRNKAGVVAAHAARVHGLDDAKAAAALGRRSADLGRRLPALVQVNVGGEASKGGVAPADLARFLDAVCDLDGLQVDGLMTVPPAGSRADARRDFAHLAALRDRLQSPERPLPQLSMGMSGDFEQAIAMGATLVRVGTAIFGTRA